jgi:hypothetical protein
MKVLEAMMNIIGPGIPFLGVQKIKLHGLLMLIIGPGFCQPHPKLPLGLGQDFGAQASTAIMLWKA